MAEVEYVANLAFDSPRRFKHKNILFIPSESYCAATITIIQGLHRLGFKIYTPFHSNINSWFCNHSWAGQAWLKFDFVLSNLHWGTRWDRYKTFKLLDHFKVLIDGDDTRHGRNWRERYRGWCEVYPTMKPASIENLSMYDLRWMVDLGDYEPDLVFSAQKAPEDEESIYLPFGLQEDYTKYARPISWHVRKMAVTNIPGDGPRRTKLSHMLAKNPHLFPGPLHNSKVMGEWKCAPEIKAMCAHDPNIHSWHRWRIYPAYYDLLSDSRIMIYPGIFDFPQYESKRQWEALACGTLVLWARPTIDMSSYPIIMDDDVVYDDFRDLVYKCNRFIDRPEEGEIAAAKYFTRATVYFNPMALARRFLWYVAERMGL